jgi:hypothetical protein
MLCKLISLPPSLISHSLSAARVLNLKMKEKHVQTRVERERENFPHVPSDEIKHL